jgi:AraC-like DNA-binding protein
MLWLQIALCFAGNTLTLLVVGLLLRDARQFIAARIAIVLFIGTIGYSLSLLPEPLALEGHAETFAYLLNVPVLGLNWLLGRALMEDDFSMRVPEWTVLAATSALMFALAAPGFGIDLPAGEATQGLALAAGLAVMLHIIWIAVSGFRGDLVDTRRTLRIGFVLLVVTSYVAISAIELLGLGLTAEAIVFDTTTLAINLAILFWAARLDTSRLFTPSPKAQTRAAPSSPRPVSPDAVQRLHRVMEAEHAYREHDMSITRLAERLRLPEHQTRKLINGALGYRNFPAFLNSYRIADAKAALADPDKAHLPVLTIAMDAGYATLSTFNRAFKSIEGDTPTEFRQRELARQT